MRLIIDTGSRHEQVYIEVDHEEYAHLLQFAGMKGHGPRMTKLVAKAYEYSVIVTSLDYMHKLPGDWSTTRPEDATTSDRVFGIPLRMNDH